MNTKNARYIFPLFKQNKPVPSLKWLFYWNTLQTQLDIIEWIEQYVMRAAMLRCPVTRDRAVQGRGTWHRAALALDHCINVGPGAQPAQSSPPPPPGDTVTRQ